MKNALIAKDPVPSDMLTFFDDPAEMAAMEEWVGGTAESTLIVGFPGGGKTTLASGWPGVYFLNADNKMAGLPDEIRRRSKTFHHGDPVYGIITALFDMMVADLQVAVKQGIKTIVIDTLTNLCEYMEVEIINIARFNPKPTGAMQLHHYGIIHSRIGEIIRTAKEIGINLVMIAHPQEVQDGEGEILYHPNVTGNKLAPKLAGKFDHVIWMEQTEKGFVSQLKATRRFPHAKLSMARDMYKFAPKAVTDLTYDTFRGIIEGKINTKKTKAKS